jgi:lipopolysaccharide biosynthesis regulator YciM
MHFMGGYELSLATGNEEVWAKVMRGDVQNHIELATAYADAGLLADAEAILARVEGNPMLEYLRGYYKELAGNAAAAAPMYAKARLGSPDYVNPHRLEEMEALEAALRHDPKDARAHLYLGNLLYSKRRREEGLKQWRTAASLEPALVHAWRNVAYAERNLNDDPKAAYQAYTKAFSIAPADARVLLELDQVSEEIKVPAASRFALLEKHLDTVNSRDDLVARLVDLRLQQGDRRNLELAHEALAKRHFRSWEGRYGIHHAWVEANQRLGDLAFAAKDYPAALNYYTRAGEYPKNLEVAPRTPDFRAHVLWPLAKTETAAGNRAKAGEYLKQILAEQYGKPHLGTYYQALAQKALGNDAQYRTLLASLEKRARELTSGSFENRGTAELVGHYLLALVLDEKGDKTAAEAERRKALDGDPEVARRAVLEAQIDVARAHQ